MGFSVGGKEKETMQSNVSAYVVKSKCNNQLPEAVEVLGTLQMGPGLNCKCPLPCCTSEHDRELLHQHCEQPSRLRT